MLKRLISAVVGSRHDRERRRIQPIIDRINEWDEKLQRVSEDELRGQTQKFRALISERTGELEKKVAELKERKRTAKDAAERERIDISSTEIRERVRVGKPIRGFVTDDVAAFIARDGLYR